MTRLRTRPHPIAAFLGFMIFGPFLLAAAALIGALSLAAFALDDLIRAVGRKR